MRPIFPFPNLVFRNKPFCCKKFGNHLSQTYASLFVSGVIPTAVAGLSVARCLIRLGSGLFFFEYLLMYARLFCQKGNSTYYRSRRYFLDIEVESIIYADPMTYWWRYPLLEALPVHYLTSLEITPKFDFLPHLLTYMRIFHLGHSTPASSECYSEQCNLGTSC